MSNDVTFNHVRIKNTGDEPLLQMVVTNATATGISTEIKENDAVLWWRQNAHLFPMLRSLAQRNLWPPLSSVASEQLFSTAGDICSANRTRLLTEIAEMPIKPCFHLHAT